jgi:Icc-related predicted phosphoesterase
MLFASDVHGAVGSLRKLASLGETLVILGDLVNLTDYRDGEGAVAEVLGLEFAKETAKARGRGDYAGMRALWGEAIGDRREEVRRDIGEVIERQYREVSEALSVGHGLVIHGNVDRPALLRQTLPAGFRYVQGEVVEIEGVRLGMVGGGVPTSLQAEGEIDDGEMRLLLDQLGPVDVLCTHVPPAIGPLRADVITGRAERASQPVLDYLRAHQPRFHLYGDVHQPQATTWRVGHTRCINAGYFRATGRYIRLDEAGVQPGIVG